MKRRNFIGIAATSLSFPLYSFSGKKNTDSNVDIRHVLSLDKNINRIYTKAEIAPFRLFHITDTHLAMDDERGIPFKKYSERMGNAYKMNKHFETSADTTCAQSFEATLQKAKEQNIDFLALTGDIFSFPSEAAVDWVKQKLEETRIPYGYVAGNHDWHYEGMPGSSSQLRETWTQKRLNVLYQGNHPLYACYEINGVNLVFIDNSTYEILPEQLDYFRQQVKKQKPMLLFMHIPLYMPGRSMGYGCANPQWGEETDNGYEIERREKWRKGGHTKATFNFKEEVFNAANLLAVYTGHTHHPAMDIENGIPQIVSGHNATGYYTDVNLFQSL